MRYCWERVETAKAGGWTVLFLKTSFLGCQLLCAVRWEPFNKILSSFFFLFFFFCSSSEGGNGTCFVYWCSSTAHGLLVMEMSPWKYLCIPMLQIGVKSGKSRKDKRGRMVERGKEKRSRKQIAVRRRRTKQKKAVWAPKEWVEVGDLLIDTVWCWSCVEIEIICFGSGSCPLHVRPWPAARGSLQPAASAPAAACSDRHLCADTEIVPLRYLGPAYSSLFCWGIDSRLFALRWILQGKACKMENKR